MIRIGASHYELEFPGKTREQAREARQFLESFISLLNRSHLFVHHREERQLARRKTKLPTQPIGQIHRTLQENMAAGDTA
jgi:hypothetical protein